MLPICYATQEALELLHTVLWCLFNNQEWSKKKRIGTYGKKEQRTKPEVIVISLINQGILPLISFHLKKEIRTKKGTVSQQRMFKGKKTLLPYNNRMLRHFSWGMKGLNLHDSIRIACSVRKNRKYFTVSYNTEAMERQMNSSGLNTKRIFIQQSSWYSVPWNTKIQWTQNDLANLWQKAAQRVVKHTAFGFGRN